jgi:ElaB/YqjD/DUF883 family membrane-anchored ribosome-binding protein
MQDGEVTADKLAADIRLVIADAEALLRATAGEADETIAAARARVRDSLDSARAGLGALGEETIEQARAALHAADSYVRENPWQALGIAALAGIALGLLISRK